MVLENGRKAIIESHFMGKKTKEFGNLFCIVNREREKSKMIPRIQTQVTKKRSYKHKIKH